MKDKGTAIISISNCYCCPHLSIRLIIYQCKCVARLKICRHLYSTLTELWWWILTCMRQHGVSMWKSFVTERWPFFQRKILKVKIHIGKISCCGDRHGNLICLCPVQKFLCTLQPDIYLKAVEKLSAKAEECVVFEDAVSGVISADRAGIGRIIGIYADSSRELLEETGKTDICAASPTDTLNQLLLYKQTKKKQAFFTKNLLFS